jgi:diketogulonate reductase-like aldo/keto reductase
MIGAPAEKDHIVIDALKAVALELNASPAAVALAWVQGRAGVNSTIIGARRIDQLHDNLAAFDVELTEAQIATLDKISKPVLGFPVEINNRVAPGLAFGGATVDGKSTKASPLLTGSAVRY